MSNSCCEDFENHAKNFHKSGFGVYSATAESLPEATARVALLLYQTAEEEGAETGAVRIRYCPWCGACLNRQLV
jgi:hypothetical protein